MKPTVSALTPVRVMVPMFGFSELAPNVPPVAVRLNSQLTSSSGGSTASPVESGSTVVDDVTDSSATGSPRSSALDRSVTNQATPAATSAVMTSAAIHLGVEDPAPCPAGRSAFDSSPNVVKSDGSCSGSVICASLLRARRGAVPHADPAGCLRHPSAERASG